MPVRRPLVLVAWILAALVAATLVSVCVLLLVMWREHATPVTLPQPTGSLAVGRALFVWTTPAGGERAVWIWYPARRSDRDNVPADYLPPAWRAALRDRQGPFMRSFFKHDPQAVRTHSRSAAALSSDQPKYPLVLLRAGGSALTTDFTTLAEDLASHGYIVAGFDAPERSFVFVGSDGRVIGRAPASNVENANDNLDDPRIAKLHAMWTADATFLVERLQRANGDPSAMFYGRIDFDRVGMVGHSFGGATALQFCHEDRRCRAAVDLDGIPFGSVVTEGLAKPAMFVLSDHSREMSDPASRRVLAEIQGIYDRLPTPRVYATIRTANHFTFSDQSLLNSRTATAILRVIGWGSLDPRRGLAISNDHVRTFLDVALNGRPPAALTQLSQRYPEVTAAF
jgi:predicted dienelactone hydrolase